MSAQAMLAKRRALEDQTYHNTLKLKEDFKLSALADWEVKTTKTIQRKQIELRAKQLAKEEADDLGSRRSALKSLYSSEMSSWKIALASQAETLSERKERIRARAHLLKSQRESERQRFVKSMYDKQWRDACDDARTLDSNAVVEKLVRDRKTAINYREGDGKAKAAEEAREQAKVWKKQMDELDAKERADQKKRHDKNVANREGLDEQCRILNGKKKELKDRNLEDEKRDLLNWKAEEEAERKKQQDLLEAAYARGTATKNFNLANMGKDKIKKTRERQQDLLLLQYAMEKEQSEIRAELGKKEAEKQESQKYRKFLEEQMIKEAEDTKDIDEHRKKESEKIWIKRDMDKKAQDDARAHLMNEVDLGRREQIRLHIEKEEDDRKYYLEQVALDKMEWDRQEAVEQDKLARIKSGVVHNNTVLKAQIALREKNRMIEEQQKFLLNKQMDYMEKKHQARLKEQAGFVRDYHPRKHTNWYT
mmetsp:Transcript_16652/g.31133  ORF Transcript_16652/g.31133 Transcript_16652/m.31133 type:complete len:479 (-) Transcript_16652:31-1467(-)|eukprot:CAMPEP_0182491292 /NCGR_PEP_ID=MMETSP1321-20130603/806_1 /TAXON_ID=91990 /ORGANISM="Bolidomonas sp., Strain RCC1657" /LENGTH=478 /DNA_ID=CAMNT_0024693565 /DNA_START=1 /DNA_END=1437 /DNA_ORIENTATION=-